MVALRPRRWVATLAFAIAVPAAVASCSVLSSTNDQCVTTQDCTARGAAFEGTQCVANLCVKSTQLPDAGGVDGCKLVTVTRDFASSSTSSKVGIW